MANKKQQQEREALLAKYAQQFPTVARILNAQDREVGIVVCENEDRYLTLMADQCRPGVYFAAQTSETMGRAMQVGCSYGYGYSATFPLSGEWS